MYDFSIGIMLDSLRMPIPQALKAAADMNVRGIQLYATSGEMAPENMGAAKRRQFLHMVKDAGLKISALCGDLGHGFGDASLNPGLIERSRLIMELAKELEANIVTTHIGVIPSSPHHERYKIMQAACSELAMFAHDLDGYFAIETGPEPSDVLKSFLDGISSPGIAVNLDPANLKMVINESPQEAVNNLKQYIVHTHAKDGRQLYYKNPEMVYGLIPNDNPAPSFMETPLGEGDVDFPSYLKALRDTGYNGFLTIEREVGSNPRADIEKAVRFLRSIIE